MNEKAWIISIYGRQMLTEGVVPASDPGPRKGSTVVQRWSKLSMEQTRTGRPSIGQNASGYPLPFLSRGVTFPFLVPRDCPFVSDPDPKEKRALFLELFIV